MQICLHSLHIKNISWLSHFLQEKKVHISLNGSPSPSQSGPIYMSSMIFVLIFLLIIRTPLWILEHSMLSTSCSFFLECTPPLLSVWQSHGYPSRPKTLKSPLHSHKTDLGHNYIPSLWLSCSNLSTVMQKHISQWIDFLHWWVGSFSRWRGSVLTQSREVLWLRHTCCKDLPAVCWLRTLDNSINCFWVPFLPL